jgi:hypothetical protein
MENYYNLKSSDFIPFKGMVNYGNRIYKEGMTLEEIKSNISPNRKEIDKRQALLFAYNMGLFFITGIGLEKILQ